MADVATGDVRARARRFRRNKTAAEVKLWRALRELNRQGFHFRQQSPIGTYIVDFVDHGACLVIEADGGQHLIGDAVGYDRRRTAWLESQGYNVMRFGNPEILTNVGGCIDAILRRCGLLDQNQSDAVTQFSPVTPTPNPSPQGGGESSLRVATTEMILSAGGASPSPLVGEGRGGGTIESTGGKGWTA